MIPFQDNRVLFIAPAQYRRLASGLLSTPQQSCPSILIRLQVITRGQFHRG